MASPVPICPNNNGHFLFSKYVGDRKLLIMFLFSKRFVSFFTLHILLIAFYQEYILFVKGNYYTIDSLYLWVVTTSVSQAVCCNHDLVTQWPSRSRNLCPGVLGQPCILFPICLTTAYLRVFGRTIFPGDSTYFFFYYIR